MTTKGSFSVLSSRRRRPPRPPWCRPPLGTGAAAAATSRPRPQQYRCAHRICDNHHHRSPWSAAAQCSNGRFFNSLTGQDLDAFSDILKDGGRLLVHEGVGGDVDSNEDDATEPFFVDWTGQYGNRSAGIGRSQPRRAVLQPSTTPQVSRILAHCHRRNLAVIPQGGNTGLVGGSVPVTAGTAGHQQHQQIVLSTSRMNRIESLSEDGVFRCQSGCVLQALQEYASERGFVVPIDLGAAGTCQIGGNLSTNAGGIYYSRYGSIAANLLGATVVLPDAGGSVLHLGSGNRKDNTGYKLHQLLVGSEGTLGVITDVIFQCPPAPRSKQTALLAIPSNDAVFQVMQVARYQLGEILACLEWMDRGIVDILGRNHHLPVRLPEGKKANNNGALILLETHGTDESHDTEKLFAFLQKTMDAGLVHDGVVAQDTTQRNQFWLLRESCNPEMKGTGGYSYKYDLSLPSSQFGDFIEEMERHYSSDFPNVVSGNWGHLLDGNLHFNLTTQEFDPLLLERIEPVIYKSTMQRGGSISAEHGIGQAKTLYLPKIHDEPTLDAMRAVKALFDPKGILNPGKLLL